MKGFKKIIPILLLFPFTLISCNNVSDTVEIPVGEKDSSMFSSGDLKEFNATDYDQKIDLSTLEANYAITKAGVYYFKGSTNYQLIVNSFFSRSVSIGRSVNKSPHSPSSAYWNIGASESLLMAMIVSLVCIPARCCTAPEMPTAM